MTTIEHFVRQGINDLSDLQEALQTAMRLEFSTLPPYLCAEWSISNSDPDRVASMIHSIVLQEMYHFALAGNVLTAIGGLPKVANPHFLTDYPTHTLPGGVNQTLAVDLLPLSKDQLQVFMQIETPEFPPIEVAADFALGPPTIGDFYTTISAALEAQAPAIDANAAFITWGAEVFQITSIADALRAIEQIKIEGEGTPGRPDQPAQPDQLAHYYLFKQIHLENILKFDAALGKLVPVPGAQVRFPSVTQFSRSMEQPNPSIKFNKLLSVLLSRLEDCWTKRATIYDAVADMIALSVEGKALIERGNCPEFSWSAAS